MFYYDTILKNSGDVVCQVDGKQIDLPPVEGLVILNIGRFV
jgi:hypothetical protein